MVAFFQSLHKTLAAGVGLLIVLIIVVGLISGQFIKLDAAWWLFFWRWLHILAGIMWMGLLWYLNFVQTPTVPKIEPAEHRAAITKFIAPNVLFWFRYSALATVVFGLTLALHKGYLIQALTFQRRRCPDRHRHVAGADHGVQCLVHHLAEPEEGAGTGRGVRGRESRGRAPCRHDLAHQHHAVDPDALLHGGAEQRRPLIARHGLGRHRVVRS